MIVPFIRAGGLNVHYLERGSGTPVVFVHGNWATSSWWEPLLDRLPGGWRGLAYDLRGRGRTIGPDSSYSIPSLAEDLKAFADALGLETPYLVGHSLGGAVVMQFALAYPARVKALAAIAPPWVDGMPATILAPQRQRILKASPMLFAVALKAVAPTVANDAYWKRLVAEGHAQRLAAALGAISGLTGWRPGDRLRSIPCPKLVIGGERDILITPPVVERVAEALGARRVMLPEVGHSPNIEAPDSCLGHLVAHFS
jgi:pimeloyl-ACP methyl ester carboxylesterase